jgi:hypothetical protein
MPIADTARSSIQSPVGAQRAARLLPLSLVRSAQQQEEPRSLARSLFNTLLLRLLLLLLLVAFGNICLCFVFCSASLHQSSSSSAAIYEVNHIYFPQILLICFTFCWTPTAAAAARKQTNKQTELHHYLRLLCLISCSRSYFPGTLWFCLL